ncbi:MAG: HlyD family type I secretion periplasmic adaptor subunit [Rhodobacteraceae bacterium]|nr:HlyD family type I secretion periplasmic adaptor subunit [Paracoccaceae bacterium]
MTAKRTPDAMFSARRPILIGVISLMLLVGGFGGWMVFTVIAGAIVAPGRVEVDQNRQVVQHIDGGTVEELLVKEGDVVQAGDVLIRLDGTDLTSQLSINDSQLYEVMARVGRLEAEREDGAEIRFDPALLAEAEAHPDIADVVEGQRRLFEARRETLERQVEQLEKRTAQVQSQITGIDAQQDALGSQLGLIREELSDQKTLLASGLAQKSRLLELQREEARLSGTLGELQASKAEAEGRITETDIQVIGLRNQRREDAISQLRDVQSKEYELQERGRALRQKLARLDITAPVSGVVYDLKVFARRSVIRPADPVLFIVPQDRPLVIMTQVQPINIDEVFPGQQVHLRFPSLSSRTTPDLDGKVVRVSPDAFVDEAKGISYYRAELVLDEGEMSKLPEGAKLLPGMPVEAFLRTHDRTALAYLLKPFTDYFAKAFRET